MAADYHTRVDILELKDHIFQRIGHERAEKYFDHLNKFLCLKVSKAEFAKSCIQTIGRENISLHNRLIKSILHNAGPAEIPPRKARKVEAQSAKITTGCQRSYLQSLCGDALSPRKCRSPLSRDRKLRDRPSPLGPLGKSPSLTVEETLSRLQEQQSTLPPLGFASVEEGEEVEQLAVGPSSQRWSSIIAPLGVSISDPRGLFPGLLHNHFDETCLGSGELPDTRSLGRRLQKRLALEGVGISLDGANLLNKSLDVYLKRIISSSIDIARSRSVNPFIETSGFGSANPFIDQTINGFSRILPGNYTESPMQSANANMLDFHVAMGTSPSILGGDRALQLEQINYPL